MRKYIENIAGPIPDKDWNLYEENLTVKKAKKGEIILPINKKCTTIWHLTKGAVRKKV